MKKLDEILNKILDNKGEIENLIKITDSYYTFKFKNSQYKFSLKYESLSKNVYIEINMNDKLNFNDKYIQRIINLTENGEISSVTFNYDSEKIGKDELINEMYKIIDSLIGKKGYYKVNYGDIYREVMSYFNKDERLETLFGENFFLSGKLSELQELLTNVILKYNNIIESENFSKILVGIDKQDMYKSIISGIGKEKDEDKNSYKILNNLLSYDNFNIYSDSNEKFIKNLGIYIEKIIDKVIEEKEIKDKIKNIPVGLFKLSCSIKDDEINIKDTFKKETSFYKFDLGYDGFEQKNGLYIFNFNLSESLLDGRFVRKDKLKHAKYFIEEINKLKLLNEISDRWKNTKFSFMLDTYNIFENIRNDVRQKEYYPELRNTLRKLTSVFIENNNLIHKINIQRVGDFYFEDFTFRDFNGNIIIDKDDVNLKYFKSGAQKKSIFEFFSYFTPEMLEKTKLKNSVLKFKIFTLC